MDKRSKQTKDTKIPVKSETDAEILDNSLLEDQQKKQYYYDDSTGYEVYDPTDDDDDSE